MRRSIAFLAGLAFLLGTGAVQAAYDDAVQWFEGLSWSARSQVQTNLILTGRLRSLVQWDMSREIFDAVIGYQNELKRPATGVLSAFEYQQLDKQAIGQEDSYDIERVEDVAHNLTLSLPKKLLTTETESADGRRYASADGAIVVETRSRVGDDNDLRAGFRALIADKPGRTITESGSAPGLFYALGTEGGRSFFAFDQVWGTALIGYTVTWTEDRDAVGQWLSRYVASGLSVLDPSTLDQGPPPPLAAEYRFPENAPGMIVLDADIQGGTALNFLKALRKRPEVRVLALNSNGGNVETALALAGEVRRRGLDTYVPANMGCYSACAYVFFAGRHHWAAGQLGVHQFASGGPVTQDTESSTQFLLGTLLDALHSYGVKQGVITHMLNTPPDDMHIFSPREIADLEINVGAPVATDVALRDPLADPGVEEGAPSYRIELARYGTEAVARRAVLRLQSRLAQLLGTRHLEVQRVENEWSIVAAMPDEAEAQRLCRQIETSGTRCKPLMLD